jgi:hypothetical protein
VLGCLLLLGAALTTSRAWVPKEDYPAAAAWVRVHVAPGTPVVAATEMTAMPYQAWFGGDFPQVDTPDQLAAHVPDDADGYVLYASPPFIRSRFPELWEVLMERGVEVARFPGTLGDIVVLRLPPR